MRRGLIEDRWSYGVAPSGVHRSTVRSPPARHHSNSPAPDGPAPGTSDRHPAPVLRPHRRAGALRRPGARRSRGDRARRDAVRPSAVGGGRRSAAAVRPLRRSTYSHWPAGSVHSRVHAVGPAIPLRDESFGAPDALSRAGLQERRLPRRPGDRHGGLHRTRPRRHRLDPAVERAEGFRPGPGFAAPRDRAWHSVHHQQGRAAVPSRHDGTRRTVADHGIDVPALPGRHNPVDHPDCPPEGARPPHFVLRPVGTPPTQAPPSRLPRTLHERSDPPAGRHVRRGRRLRRGLSGRRRDTGPHGVSHTVPHRRNHRHQRAVRHLRAATPAATATGSPHTPPTPRLLPRQPLFPVRRRRGGRVSTTEVPPSAPVG